MGESRVEARRRTHSRLGLVKFTALVVKGYLACAAAVAVSAIAAAVSQLGLELPFVDRHDSFSVALLPIGVAHILLWVNSSTLYEHYFLVWDESTGQQAVSLALWLLHPLALVASVMYPPAWTLTVAALSIAILLKNVTTRLAQPRGSPVLAVLKGWIPRAGGYVAICVLFGSVFTTFSTDGFYATALGVDVNSVEAKRLIEFNRQFISWVAVVFVALGTVTRVELRERYPRRMYETYEREMEAYLAKVDG